MAEATTTTAATTTADTTTTTTTAKPWYDGKADAELVGHWQNKGWKADDPIDVAINATKQARELQKHFGVPETQLLKLPKDASDEEGWKNVYTRLGVPADANDYDFAGVNYPEGFQPEESFITTMRNALVQARVSKDRAPDVVKAVVKWLGDADAEEAAVKTALINTQRAELDKNWGANKAANMVVANNALRAVAQAAGLTAQEAVAASEALTQLGGINAAKVMEMFRVIGVRMGEDKFVTAGGGQDNRGIMTVQGAIARKAELMADKAWRSRYTDGGAPEKREMLALDQIISGVAA